MRGALRYFAARSKRALRYYPAALIFALVTALLLSALAGALLFEKEGEINEQKLRVRVGVVGNLEDTYLDLAVFALQNMDSSRVYAEMITMEPDEAEKMLDSGEIIGYVTVPEGYVETVMSGENQQLTYTVKDSPASLVPILMNEVVGTVSRYVTLSENGIYGYTDFCRDMGIPRSEYRPLADGLSVEYLMTILEREDATETKILEGTKGLDLFGYYTCAIFVIAVLLWGISFAPMMISQESSLYRLLRFNGTGAFLQTCGDFLPFLLLMVANVLLLGAAVSAFGATPEPLLLIIKLLPAVSLLCAFQYLLYEISKSPVSAVLIQLFSCVASSLASGFFFYRNALPESVALFGRLIPTGVAFDYVTDVFRKGDCSLSLLITVILTAALLLLAAVVRAGKIRRAR
ncbi:MAG: ABC transporter permease [Ruminococcaceae bacterium]|nr:ABC transporter permease [Oscillospiraceae bacterium]